MRSVPHHLLDVVSPKKIFSVSDFQKLAEKSIKDAGDKAPKAEVEKVQEKIKALKDELANTSATKESLETKTKELTDLMMKI